MSLYGVLGVGGAVGWVMIRWRRRYAQVIDGPND